MHRIERRDRNNEEWENGEEKEGNRKRGELNGFLEILEKSFDKSDYKEVIDENKRTEKIKL